MQEESARHRLAARSMLVGPTSAWAGVRVAALISQEGYRPTGRGALLPTAHPDGTDRSGCAGARVRLWRELQ